MLAERTAIDPHRLRRLRDRAGLSQHDLARAAGLSRSYIAMIETGRREGSGMATIVGLARALDVTPDELTNGDTP